jgi:hypothetical protein
MFLRWYRLMCVVKEFITDWRLNDGGNKVITGILTGEKFHRSTQQASIKYDNIS